MSEFIWTIIKALVPMVLDILRGMLSNEKFIEFADKLFDWAERKIMEEPDSYDEWLLELIQIIREALGVPDLPDEE